MFISAQTSKNTNKNRPCNKQGRKNTWYHSASHILHSICLIDFAAESLKSLSDVTVAPVMPTYISAHCSQNELHPTPGYCLAPSGNSLQPLFGLLFLLKRISLLKLWCYGNTKMSFCQELLSAENKFSSIGYAALPFVIKKFSFFCFYVVFPCISLK